MDAGAYRTYTEILSSDTAMDLNKYKNFLNILNAQNRDACITRTLIAQYRYDYDPTSFRDCCRTKPVVTCRCAILYEDMKKKINDAKDINFLNKLAEELGVKY